MQRSNVVFCQGLSCLGIFSRRRQVSGVMRNNFNYITFILFVDVARVASFGLLGETPTPGPSPRSAGEGSATAVVAWLAERLGAEGVGARELRGI